jgi:hypothetical protein
LVEILASDTSKKATLALARRALYDLNSGVRQAALLALKDRPSKEFCDVFIEGLRYPWAPVATHAGEALVTLQVRQAIPQLARLAREREPGIVFQKIVNDKPVFLVRELVRINHLRNCLMCHAPANHFRDPVAGLVPDPEKPLPTRLSPAYYSGRRSDPFVRADVTYLRQDFSVLQAVEKQGKWPKMQRYDYVVRVRPPTQDELTTFKLVGTAKASDQQKAAVFALRELQSGSSAERLKILGWRALDSEQAPKRSTQPYEAMNPVPRAPTPNLVGGTR